MYEFCSHVLSLTIRCFFFNGCEKWCLADLVPHSKEKMSNTPQVPQWRTEVAKSSEEVCSPQNLQHGKRDDLVIETPQCWIENAAQSRLCHIKNPRGGQANWQQRRAHVTITVQTLSFTNSYLNSTWQKEHW